MYEIIKIKKYLNIFIISYKNKDNSPKILILLKIKDCIEKKTKKIIQKYTKLIFSMIK